MEEMLTEFKSVYKKQGPHDLRSQIKYLSTLADHYYKQGKINSDWVSLLKAHTLYNSVAARDKDNEILWSLKAFNVQNTYWKSRDLKPDLLYEGQREITRSLKSELMDLRKATKTKVNSIKSVCSQLDSHPDLNQLSSPENLQTYEQFMDMVENTSQYCTQGVINIFSLVIGKAVEIVGQPPCQLCVAALGSLARGEATPYSDLEFIFLIGESSSDNIKYFETLALTVYFLIGNLQETKLRYMAIKELVDWFEDFSTNGLKIDGLQKVAGNIPTGNGIEQSNHLIRTVEELVSRYQEVYDNPDPKESLRGDFSAMLSSTVYIYGAVNLLHNFQTKIQFVEPTEARAQASMEMLTNDIQSYDFFPDYTLSITRNLKKDIYRYPSMLILNLRIVHRLLGFLPVYAVKELVRKNVLSTSIGNRLKFSFCCALYMRLSAYLHLHSQNENMSVLKSNADISALKRYQWFVDRPLFLHMMIQLMPLKTAVSEGKLQVDVELNSHHIRMCVATVSYYCLDYKFCCKTIGNSDNDFTNALLFTRAALRCAYFDDALDRCTKYLEELTKQEKWEELSDTVQCYSLIARIKQAKGNYAEANDYFARCIQLQKEVHDDPSHQRLAICYSRMGSLCLEWGQYDQAATYHMLSLKIHQQGHGDSDHPTMARCYSDLGKLYFEQGRYKEARLYHTKALDMCRRVYGGCDHPDIARSFYHLGDLHRNHGLYNDALICHIKSLEMRKRVFGNLDHPEIAKCYLDLGNLHSDQGQYDPAKSCYLKALNMLRKIYGESGHPDIGSCVYHLGCLHKESGKYEQAKNNYIQSLDIYNRIYGQSGHPVIARCCSSLGNLYLERGQYNEARSHYNSALTMHKSVYGNCDHPEIATCYYVLSNLNTKCGQYSEAKTDCIKSLAMCKRVYGDVPHPKVAMCYNSLGNLQMKSGLYDSASNYHSKSLEIHQQVYGDSEHPDIAKCYSHLGHLYKAQAQLKEAEEFYDKSLLMCKNIYGDCDHPEIAMCYYILGNLYVRQQNYQKGMISCIKSLEMCRRVFDSSDHPEIAMCYTILGNLYMTSEPYLDFDLAEEYHLKSLSMLNKVYPDYRHPDIGECYYNLGHLYYQQQKYDKALESQKKALHVFHSVYGSESNHLNIEQCRHHLERLERLHNTTGAQDLT